MIRWLKEAVMVELEAVIAPDIVTVTSPKHRRTVSHEAPFSCSHMLVSDIDVLEHAIAQAFKKLELSALWTFPRVTVSIRERDVHGLEKKFIRDAIMNAGAQEVSIVSSSAECKEGQSNRDAYVRAAMQAR